MGPRDTVVYSVRGVPRAPRESLGGVGRGAAAEAVLDDVDLQLDLLLPWRGRRTAGREGVRKKPDSLMDHLRTIEVLHGESCSTGPRAQVLGFWKSSSLVGRGLFSAEQVSAFIGKDKGK